MKARILVADDDPGMRETLEAVLRADGYTVFTAKNGREVMEVISGRPIEVMLLDLKMPDCTGLEVLVSARDLAPNLAVIMMTAFGTVKVAVEAVKQGAYDFLTKPFDLDEMRLCITKALDVRRLREENEQLRIMLSDNAVFSDIVAESPAMQTVFDLVRKVVNYDVTVLVTGESGTGKELIARSIHYNSERRDKPFIKLNCAALPETLLESELFGFEKGAFTGASRTKPGRFELAAGGTLFLDEIGDTSPGMQAKLLRVLQEKEFERVGGQHTIKVDVRIVAATNKDLKKEVEARRFREDLFYRLNVVPIHLPPLRERKQDIPALVAHFLKELNIAFQKNVTSVAPEVACLFEEYNWPGNIRELRNAVEKAVLLGSGHVILPEYLPDEIRRAGGNPVISETLGKTPALEELERDHIYRVLCEAGWNQSKAAEMLGIHRNTLRAKIERFGLTEPHTYGS